MSTLLFTNLMVVFASFEASTTATEIHEHLQSRGVEVVSVAMYGTNVASVSVTGASTEELGRIRRIVTERRWRGRPRVRDAEAERQAIIKAILDKQTNDLHALRLDAEIESQRRH